jgi:hypothetical protein
VLVREREVYCIRGRALRKLGPVFEPAVEVKEGSYGFPI